MQVTCFGIDWAEVAKRPSAQAVVDEMILTDDIDDFATCLPAGLWRSDSYMQHFECAEELDALRDGLSGPAALDLSHVCLIISTDEALDELGICDLTDGCNFLSIPPDKVIELSGHFGSFRETTYFDGLTSETKAWIEQWSAALEFLASRSLGMIGHAG